MVKIVELQKEQWVQLWCREHQLIMQYKEGDRCGRTILLADDCVGDVETAACGDTVYFVYRNTQGEMLLRSIRDPKIYYRMREEVLIGLTAEFTGPVLWVWNGADAEGGELQRICPMSSGVRQCVMAGIPRPSAFWITEESGEVYVVCGSGQEETVYRIDRNMQTKKWKLQDEDHFRKQEEELRQAYAEIGRLQAMIGSATRQYEELMHVAERYRDEAVKWRSKFSF